MKKYDRNKLLKAFDAFLEEDYKLAEDAGYSILTSSDTDGKTLYMDVKSEYDDLPKINVSVRPRNDTSYEFIVDVEFPDVQIKDERETLGNYIKSWEIAAKLVDDLASIEFIPEQWM